MFLHIFTTGYTRAFLANELQETPIDLLNKVQTAITSIGKGKKFLLIDGVGYPAVGSIVSLSNAHVASFLSVPVLLVSKSGVGDAVDSYNLNTAFFESFQCHVLGGIFNKFEIDGFYSLELCKEPILSYFQQYKNHQLPYGFLPKLAIDSLVNENVK
jgi:dethiobiotin synthetase